MKYLLLIVVVLVLWSVWKKRRKLPGEEAPKDRQPEQIVACAHCGLHHPLSESYRAGDATYCSQAHRLAGETTKRP